MKRLLLIVLVLFWMAPVVAWGQAPYSGNGPTYNMMTWWFSTTDPNDTLWFPGFEVLDVSTGYGDSVNVPITWGIDLLPYNYLGIEVAIITPDTTLNDSLLVSLWTGYYGDADSMLSAVAYTQIRDGALFDTCITFPSCPRAIKWTCLRDTAETTEYPWQRYIWVRLISYMTTIFATDTTFTGAPDGDVWAADGDSLYDWNTTNADGIFYKMFTTAVDYDSFAYVHGKDSLLAIAMNEMAIAESPGTIDSLTFGVAYCESIVVLAADTLRLGIAFGDSTGHHYDSLDIGVGGSGVLWSTQFPLDSSLSVTTDPRAKDTVYFTFTTDPHGNPWTRTTLDSCILIIDPVHVDTSAADEDEVPGFLYIYDLWATVYHSRTELFPEVKGRVTVYLKE